MPEPQQNAALAPFDLSEADIQRIETVLDECLTANILILPRDGGWQAMCRLTAGTSRSTGRIIPGVWPTKAVAMEKASTELERMALRILLTQDQPDGS